MTVGQLIQELEKFNNEQPVTFWADGFYHEVVGLESRDANSLGNGLYASPKSLMSDKPSPFGIIVLSPVVSYFTKHGIGHKAARIG